MPPRNRRHYLRGKLPIIVGGTGCIAPDCGQGLFSRRRHDLRRELSIRYDRLGGERMLSGYEGCGERGPFLQHAKKRIVRALEAYQTTGMTIAEHDKRTKVCRPVMGAQIALSFADRRYLHYINRRVDTM